MFKYIYILFFCVFLSLSSFCQQDIDFCNDIDDKKLLKNFKKSVSYLNSGKQDEAEQLLLEILKKEETFTEAWLALSDIYLTKYNKSKNSKQQAALYQSYIKCLVQVAITCPSYNNYYIHYQLGIIFYKYEEYDKASKYLSYYIANSSKKSNYLDDAKLILENVQSYLQIQNNPVPFVPQIVKGLSSVEDDYLPLISPDGSLGFCTRAYMKKNINTVFDKLVEEFTVSNSADDEGLNFTEGKALPYPFNAGKNQGAASITIDNSTMYVTICEFVSRDYDNCDIYYTKRTSEGWSELINLGPNINGKFTWESQPSVSSDGKLLFFSSIRSKNVGFDSNNPTSDIWYSELDKNGVWGPAKNLGEKINTSGNEKSPFIHSDSQTLYFSSDGHQGVGGYDIFFSKFRDSSWTTPKNIGYPINTKYNDLGFIVNTHGTKAYFASNKLEGMGGWDIYALDLYEEARPEKVIFVKGQLSDDEGNVLTDAKVEIKNVRTDNITEGLVNKETGQYAVCVAEEENKKDDYIMIVKQENYSFTSSLITNADTIYDKVLDVNFELKPIEVGKAIELNDIYYATVSYTIDAKSFVVLDAFASFLKENPNIIIEIRGHTDNIGSLQTNIVLSNNRAKSVYDYVITKGISKNRLTYKGYGPKMPIESNDTEYGRSKNRRTEFYIIEK